MEQRLDYTKVAPGALRAMYGLERYVRESGLEASLLHLVKMRASQINGCAFCLDRHSHDARTSGETEQRIYLLDGWREAPLYSERERAALAWTEHLTRVATDGAPASAYNALQQHFSDREIADLTVLVGMINLWTRVGVGFAMQPRARS